MVMYCVLFIQAPGGTPIARLYILTQSWKDHFATEACDEDGRSGMHDIVPVGTLVLDPVGHV